jgi:hypothetical protein
LHSLPHLDNHSVHTLGFFQNPEPDVCNMSEHKIEPLTFGLAAPAHCLSTTNRQLTKVLHDLAQHRSNSFSGRRRRRRPHIRRKIS